ncbi:MAG: ROK family glucokinase [Oscillospiraceae bacterium]
MKYYIGIDLGGTNIAAGVVDENFNIIGRGKIKTNAPRPAEEIAADMAKAAKIAVADAGLEMSDISEAGIGCPGSIDPTTGMVATSNNLKFTMVPMKKLIEDEIKIKTFIENDANAAAYGEMLAGAGKGTKDFVAITLGTGVGGGIIVDGKILSGANHAGGELGHTVIVMDGEYCNCGRNGCWEAYASATALIRQTKAAMMEHKESKMWSLCAGDISSVNGRTAFDAMRAGDAAGIAVVDMYEKYVACGIINIINTFQPEILCIGGGISREGDTLAEPIRQIIAKERYSKNIEKQTIVEIAKLGNDAGVIGAAFLGELYR